MVGDVYLLFAVVMRMLKRYKSSLSYMSRRVVG